MSRVSQEFGCLPDEAREAIENDFNGSIFKIMDMRGFADAKARIERANAKDMPTDTQATRYLEIEMSEVAKELKIGSDDSEE